jgi:hypothetical protein
MVPLALQAETIVFGLTGAVRLDPICKRAALAHPARRKVPQICQPSWHWRVMDAKPHLTPLHHILPRVVPQGTSKLASPVCLPHIQKSSDAARARASLCQPRLAQPDEAGVTYQVFREQLVAAKAAAAACQQSERQTHSPSAPSRATFVAGTTEGRSGDARPATEAWHLSIRAGGLREAGQQTQQCERPSSSPYRDRLLDSVKQFPGAP